MPNLGGPEVLIVALIFVLLFGAKKLPELGGSLGKGIKNFKKGVHEGRRHDPADPAHQPTDEIAVVPESASPERG